LFWLASFDWECAGEIVAYKKTIADDAMSILYCSIPMLIAEIGFS
jgi:hypothetical protein